MNRNRWAIFLVLLACGCGGGGIGGSSNQPGNEINPAEPFYVEGQNAAVSIPANTFTYQMTFGLTESGVETGGLPEGVSLYSEAITLHFSVPQVVLPDKSVQVRMRLNEGAPSAGLYALIRSEGSRVNEGGDIPRSGVWRPALVTYDGDRVTVSLSAAEEFVSVVIVGQSGAVQGSQSFAASVIQEAPAALAADAGVFARPWAIYCDRDNLPAASQADCRQETMGALAQIFQEAMQYLRGINVAEINTVAGSFENMETVFGADKVFSNSPHPENTIHNIAVFTGPAFCNRDTAYGCYDFATQIVLITPSTLSGNVRRSAVAHELIHAVQHRVARPAFNIPHALWVTEGTAEYVGQEFGPGEINRASRSWSTPLQNHDDSDTPYQTYRFFEKAWGGSRLRLCVSSGPGRWGRFVFDGGRGIQ